MNFPQGRRAEADKGNETPGQFDDDDNEVSLTPKQQERLSYCIVILDVGDLFCNDAARLIMIFMGERLYECVV